MSLSLSVTDWAAIITATAGVIAAVIFILELRHMNKHRDLEVTIKLFEWAETDRMRRAFRWVSDEFTLAGYQKLREENKLSEEIDHPYQVEAYFEEVGFLVNKKFVDIDVIVDRLGALIISDWKHLEPWIQQVRIARNDKTFGEHFERLFEKTVKYMNK